MPELAEVEFFRKRWDLAARGMAVTSVLTHDRAKIFRGTDPAAIRTALSGAKLLSSEAAAKQMLFRFSGDLWLGLHLGMSGDLHVEPAGYTAQKHDHLVLVTAKHRLVFTDPRMFGRVQFHHGAEAPKWWSGIAPALTSKEFTVEAVSAFLRRRGRAPIKAVLLMQERFPGIGNWMADEILWRAELHPKRLAGSLSPAEVRVLWHECRHVARLALDTIAGKGDYLPPDLNYYIPSSWLFPHRWENGGLCPKTKKPLVREEVGGRTTCWSPALQKLRPSAAQKASPRASRATPRTSRRLSAPHTRTAANFTGHTFLRAASRRSAAALPQPKPQNSTTRSSRAGKKSTAR